MSTETAPTNGILKRRKLSLDIESASRAVDLRPAVWTTPTHQRTLSEVKVDFRLNGAISTDGKKKKRKKKKKERKEDEGDLSPTTPPVIEPTLSFRERYLSWRYAMVFMFQCSFVVAVFLRNNMPVALVCMTKPPSAASSSPVNVSSQGKELLSDSSQTSGAMSYSMEGNFTRPVKEDALTSSYEFDWDGQIQSMLLTATILLSFSGPLIGNALQTCITKKRLLTLGTASAGLLTLMCPTAARVSPYALAGIRVVLGILFGFNVPVVGDSLAWWAPQGEKLTMVSMSFMGINIGGIFTSLISGFLCSVPLDNGWPFNFYVFGSLALIFLVAWHFISSPKPEDHPFISEKEKEYIITYRADMEGDEQKKKEKPPYKKILSSVPVLAFITAGCSQLWVVNILVSYLPIYYVDILGFSVQEAGVLISVAVLCRMCGAIMWTVLGNCLTSRFNTRVSRKICMVTGFGIAGVALIGVSFFDRSNRWISFILLIMSSFAQSCGSSTLSAVPLDMAPRYSGLLTGMFVSIASLFTVTGPPLVSILTPTGSESEWQVVMIILGVMNILGGTVFGVFGSATIQPWAKVHRKSMPEIVSPFVTMGRRISTFMERPPITPVSPVPHAPDGNYDPEDIAKDRRFDFSLKIKQPPSSPSKNNIPQSPEPKGNSGGFFGDVELSNVVAGDVHRGPGDEEGDDTAGQDNEAYDNDENRSGDESSDEDGESEGDENEDDNESRPKPRKRAFSEFGLEVARMPLELQHSIEEKKKEGMFIQNETETTVRKRKIPVIHRPNDFPKSTEDQENSRTSDSYEREAGNKQHGVSIPNDGEKIDEPEVNVTLNSQSNSNCPDHKSGEIPSQIDSHVISVRL